MNTLSLTSLRQLFCGFPCSSVTHLRIAANHNGTWLHNFGPQYVSELAKHMPDLEEISLGQLGIQLSAISNALCCHKMTQERAHAGSNGCHTWTQMSTSAAHLSVSGCVDHFGGKGRKLPSKVRPELMRAFEARQAIAMGIVDHHTRQTWLPKIPISPTAPLTKASTYLVPSPLWS
jgi:hypothetical protein